MIRPDKLDSGTTVKGLDYIDVPGGASRDYKLTFHAHKAGTTHMKVYTVFCSSCLHNTHNHQSKSVTF